MRTVAIINQKGGCGKTTTSINLAACLARLGHRTLLVDMDPQGHCGVGLAVPEEQIERTIFDVLIEPCDGKVARLSEVVWQIATDFDLAPSNIRLAAFEQLFAGREGREDRLASALAQVRDAYEWCVIDCPPSVGLLTFNALRACDEAIVPVETGFFSLHGLGKMMETLDVLREQCGRDVQVKVLPTQYDTRTKLAREVLSELRSRFRGHLMQCTINFNTKLKEAASFGQPITEYDPGSRGYKDFVNLARELMGHRPLEMETAAAGGGGTAQARLSRPAELVQRARQLAQLTNVQFGRTSVATATAAAAAAAATQRAAAGREHEPALSLVGAGHEGAVGLAEAGQFQQEQHDANGRSLEPTLAEAEAMAFAAADAEADVDVDADADARAELAQAQAAAAEAEAKAAEEAAEARDRATEAKIREFYGVKQVGREVVFAAKFEDAASVAVAGDFNGWRPEAAPMQHGRRAGEWRMALALEPGRYRYRLVVDGRWVTDPNNQYVEANQFGELNNVFEVEAA